MTGGRGEFLRYLVLRATTAGATLVTGFAQTFVFARVLDPHSFSVFIVIGNLGLSLWLFDLGIAKVLYVGLRERFLAGRLGFYATSHKNAPEPITPDPIRVEATAITALYALLAVAGAVACWVFAGDAGQGLSYALFFIYAALNLAWFALRNIASAADQFLFFEGMEAARRLGHLALLFALLAGLPFMAFLWTSNLVWLVLLVVVIGRLRAAGAVSLADPWALWRALRQFFADNRTALLGSSGYAAGEMAVYNYPSVLVPAVMGLGAPVIIFDTAFKIFRGATVLFSAACDLMVPRQTRSYQAGDRRGIWRATAVALGLGLAPAAALCGLLLIAGEPLYRLLLGAAATMPSSVTPILVVMIACNLLQTVANFVLAHTGFFAPMARTAGLMTAVMAVVAGITALAGLDVIGFLVLYAVAYAVSAGLYVRLALRGPLAVSPAPGGNGAP